MSFVTDGSARVTVVLVALGYHERMIAALQRMAAYVCEQPFEMVCVVNTANPESPLRGEVPPGVVVDEHPGNLGWVGGLHAGRAKAKTSRMAWMQDDVTVDPGWLDALVATLEADPKLGMCGARVCNEDGIPEGIQAGFTLAGVEVRKWTHSDIGFEDTGELPVRCAWVPSAGSVVDLAAWDAVGGVDVRMFPLGWVDFDYCSHLRAHGYEIAHVPNARIRHVRHTTAGGELAQFASTRNLDHIARRWEAATWNLGPWEASVIPHACAPWLGETPQEIARHAVDQGSALMVPFGRHVDTTIDTLREDLHDTRAALDQQWDALVKLQASTSWKVTAPLRWVVGLLRPTKR